MSFAQRYGEWAIVAGASDGTGAEFCRQVAAKGMNVIAIARRGDPLEEVARRVRNETGREVLTKVIDLSGEDASDQVVETAGNRDVGLFVMNAGSDPNGSRFLDKPIEDWLKLVQRNSITTMKLSYHFAKSMRDKRRGGILLVNSAAGYRGSSFMTVYAASKAFVLCLAQGMWAELHNLGIDVLSFHLVMTDTPFYRELLSRSDLPLPPGTWAPEDVVARALEMLPHGPTSNIGYDNNEAGFALIAPDVMREVILQTDVSAKATFGEI